MALRGYPNYHGNGRKKAKSMALGRCELCGVDFTSECQRESHMTGKKHLKNVRLVDQGQPVCFEYIPHIFESTNDTVYRILVSSHLLL